VKNTVAEMRNQLEGLIKMKRREKTSYQYFRNERGTSLGGAISSRAVFSSSAKKEKNQLVRPFEDGRPKEGKQRQGGKEEKTVPGFHAGKGMAEGKKYWLFLPDRIARPRLGRYEK